MIKIYKIAIFLFLITFSFHAKSHVQHYDDLNLIVFDIYRNNKNIGTHIFKFIRKDNQIEVDSEINFEIKKLGVVLYRYHVKGKEVYKNGQLVKFNSKTKQNGKEKYVNLELKEGKFVIDGSSYKGETSIDYLLGTWWNHSIVKAKAQISAVSGRIIHQNVKFLGKETIKIGEKEYKTLRFNFSSSDERLSKDKKLNTDVWYDENTLNWIKASFKKRGNWEYKLVTIK